MTVTAPAPRGLRVPPPAAALGVAAASAPVCCCWWRRLTAMRTAIVLLFLLALAAVPGSLLPAALAVAEQGHAVLRRAPDAGAGAGPALPVRRLQLAVVRRGLPAAVHLADRLRAAPRARALPRPAGGRPGPRNLLRLPDSGELTRADRGGRRSTWSRRSCGSAASASSVEEGEVSAEKGYLKETGNLLFHLSLVALLLGLAGGKLWGYEGSILVTEGRASATPSSSTTRTRRRAGRQRRPEPLCVDLEDFRAEYEQNLTAASFTADIRYGARARTAGHHDRRQRAAAGRRRPGLRDRPRLQPDLHRHPARRHRAHRRLGAVPAVRPVDDGQPGRAQAAPTSGPASDDQLALEGFFAPTGLVHGGILTSVDPRPLAPQVAIVVYQGYLGLDSGIPQSVYSLDATPDRPRPADRGRGEPGGGASR